jgi:hypothetical protein
MDMTLFLTIHQLVGICAVDFLLSFFAVMNNAVMTILLDIYLAMELLDHMVSLCLSF